MDNQVEKLMAERTPLVPQCVKNDIEEEGKATFCSRADGNFCGAYAFPDKKWRVADCPLADGFLRTVAETKSTEKVRVGQQKQKKK